LCRYSSCSLAFPIRTRIDRLAPFSCAPDTPVHQYALGIPLSVPSKRQCGHTHATRLYHAHWETRQRKERERNERVPIRTERRKFILRRPPKPITAVMIPALQLRPRSITREQHDRNRHQWCTFLRDGNKEGNMSFRYMWSEI